MVKKKVQAGWSECRQVSGVICLTRIAARVKEKLDKVVVRPADMYGLETLTLTKKRSFSLEMTRMKKIRNEYISLG